MGKLIAAISFAFALHYAEAAIAQQPPSAPADPIAGLRAEDLEMVLSARERQLADLMKRLEAEHQYWRGYIAGINNPLRNASPSK